MGPGTTLHSFALSSRPAASSSGISARAPNKGNDEDEDDGEDEDEDDEEDEDDIDMAMLESAEAEGGSDGGGATVSDAASPSLPDVSGELNNASQPAAAAPPRPAGAAEAFSRLQASTSGRAVRLSKRMQSDLLEIMRSDIASRGMAVELADETRLDVWRVRYTSFPEGSRLANELALLSELVKPPPPPPAGRAAGGGDAAAAASAKQGPAAPAASAVASSSSSWAEEAPPACVECEMTFPQDYPFSPPSVRVVRPRFKRSTGYVIGGALCMELLTPQGWNATFSIEALLEQMRAHVAHGKAALDLPAELLRRPAPPDGAGRGDDGEAAAAAPARPNPRAAGRRAAAGGGGASPAPSDAEALIDPSALTQEQRRAAAKAAARVLRSEYSVGESQRAFHHIVDFHEKQGWVPMNRVQS